MGSSEVAAINKDIITITCNGNTITCPSSDADGAGETSTQREVQSFKLSAITATWNGPAAHHGGLHLQRRQGDCLCSSRSHQGAGLTEEANGPQANWKCVG